MSSSGQESLFRRILIANRGEIAVRIIRACRELGIETVAVHSDVDEESLHVKLADESICIGPAPARDSYLNVAAILSAAKITGADAIHPGYGFLAENDRFAELVEQSGFCFIGPSASSIRAMGNKVSARKRMEEAGVPVVPGMYLNGATATAADVVAKIKPPLLVKAAAGGGGRGMRIVRAVEDFDASLAAAQNEAQSAFGSREVYIERYMERARHIEIQIVADKAGRTIHLGERDCSTQRRHQKLVEEAPSPALTPELRRRMGDAAISAAAAVGYHTVGTIEFLLAEDKEFYFLEMNTRIQVEHPVTELVTNVDLVKLQIRLAAGESLDMDSMEELNGHAIECRINAEDYTKNFAPQGGQIKALHLPGGPGIRIDTHIYEGYRVPTNYDSLLMKILAKGSNRREAIIRMQRALGELVIEGVPTTAAFHRKYLDDENFINGEIDTGYVERWLGSIRS